MFYFCKTLHSLWVCASNNLYNSYINTYSSDVLNQWPIRNIKFSRTGIEPVTDGWPWGWWSPTTVRRHRLVWATKLLLAAIVLVFPVLVLGYKSFNCSMYLVPVPTLIEKFVWIYFQQLFTVAGSIIFWHTNSRSLLSILYQFLRTFLNLYDYPSNS